MTRTFVGISSKCQLHFISFFLFVQLKSRASRHFAHNGYGMSYNQCKQYKNYLMDYPSYGYLFSRFHFECFHITIMPYNVLQFVFTEYICSIYNFIVKHEMH